MRLGQVEPEQVQHADDDVELARDAQVEQERPEHVAAPGRATVIDLGGSSDQQLVDQPIEDQLDRARGRSTRTPTW